MNRIKDAAFRAWKKLPHGLRVKPLDMTVSLLLIMYALAILELNAFKPFSFLSSDVAYEMIIETFVTVYLITGGVLIIYGLLSHARHNSILSFCSSEIWGWRLIFSACSVIFLAEVVSGLSLAVMIWFLQAFGALLKLLQYYDERRMEQRIWTQ